MRHVLSALVQNQPGVLAQVSGMFASRGFNIESLAVGPTETETMSRITVVVKGDDKTLEQVRKQLEKIITVVSVQDVSQYDYVERDLLLLRVRANTTTRQDVLSLINIFRGKVVDVTPQELMVELAGQEKKIQAFIEAISPFGILEMARTGRIALIRGSKPDTLEPADESLTSDQPQVVGHSSL